MTLNGVRQEIVAKAGELTDGGESLVGVARVWATDTRRRVPLLFRQRRFYDLAVSDQRLILLARPRRFRVWNRKREETESPVVSIRHSSLSVAHARSVALLLQLRLATLDGQHQLVIEFRPADRGVARELVGRISQASRAPQPV